MKNISAIIIFIIALGFSSCEETIEFKGDETGQKIVVYSILSPDSLINVDITESYAIYDYKYRQEQINNAEINIYSEGNLLETLSYQPTPGSIDDWRSQYSHYSAKNLRAEEGKTYRLEVKVPGYEPVSSECTIPEKVPAEGIDTSYVALMEQDDWNYGMKRIRAKLHFKDPPEKENFYRLKVSTFQGSYYGDPGYPYNSRNPVVLEHFVAYYINSDDPVFGTNRDEGFFGTNDENQYSVFSDELIAGKEYDLQFMLELYDPPDISLHEFIQYKVHLQSLSQELYLFLKSSSAQRTSDGAVFNEPVLVYSNIENGLGVFGGYSYSTQEVMIGEYPVEGVYYQEGENHTY